MENLLSIACQAAGDYAVWVCAHCESNIMGGSACDVCDQPRWTVCDVECECTPRFRPASIAVFVDLWGDVPLPPAPTCPVQVPLPYFWEWEVPENYGELFDVEREGPIQLRMRLN